MVSSFQILPVYSAALSEDEEQFRKFKTQT